MIVGDYEWTRNNPQLYELTFVLVLAAKQVKQPSANTYAIIDDSKKSNLQFMK